MTTTMCTLLGSLRARRQAVLLSLGAPAFAVGFGLLFVGIQARGPGRPAPRMAGPTLPVGSNTVSLGRLEVGQSAHTKITLNSKRASPVAVDHFETSCPCLRVAPASIRIGPEGSADIEIWFDPSEDPAFRGDLSVLLIGRLADGGSAFEVRVEVEVRGGHS